MSESKPMGVAVVGVGKISESYGKSLVTKPEKVCLLGAYDLVADRAAAFTAEFGGQVYDTYEALLADERVDIVLNLTIQQTHAEVTTKALLAGKHVHSEKPLAAAREDGLRLVELAESKGLRLSCSPFTFMGEAQQTLIKAFQKEGIGKPLVAYAEANWGPNHRWNPRPLPFHQRGGGPLLDVGVYPLTLLTTILGPITRVTGFAHIVEPERTIMTGEDKGKTFKVETPDHVLAGLEFASGVIGRLTAGFCSVKSKQVNGVEIHGENGTLAITAADNFNAAVEQFSWESKAWKPVWTLKEPYDGVEWGRGVFDLVDSIQNGGVQHCTGQHAYHVLDVCLSILESAEKGQALDVRSSFEPPPLMPWARVQQPLANGE